MSFCFGCCHKGHQENEHPIRSSASIVPDTHPALSNPKRQTLIWYTSEPMNMAQLAQKRREFWETAPSYGGKKEAWEALESACGCDPELANAICASVGLILPRGNLGECYDETGWKYEVPVYCQSNPANLQSPFIAATNSTRRVKSIEVRVTLRFANNLDDHNVQIDSRSQLGELIVHIDKLLEKTAYKEVLFFHQGQGPLPHDRLIGEVIERDKGLIQVLIR
jgi:hypothetical protein